MAGTGQKGWTCSQLSHPSAVNEAKQKKASRQRQRGCMKKVGSKRVDRLFFKTKVSNYSHWLRGREERPSHISQGEVLWLTTFLA